MRTKGFYNGFSPAGRSGTLAIIKAAIADGSFAMPIACSVCQQPSEKPLGWHSEDYRRPLDALPICRGCHVRVHARFQHPKSWQAFIRNLEEGAWFQNLSVDPQSLTRPFDETYPGGLPQPR
jgi:hypothetical protein